MNLSGNHWYHCTVTTYGSWIRGDERGWRARHHREHVNGDYKNLPTPGSQDAHREQSGHLMKRPLILLSPDQRLIICKLIAEYLDHFQIIWIDCCVSATHFHLLVQITPEVSERVGGLVNHNTLKDGRDPLPRYVLGRIKLRTSLMLRQQGLHTQPGGLWATRSHVTPIRNRQHQLQTVRYIRDHVTEGACVWSQIKKKSSEL